jgi:formylglycine-generating enzyme required for sulfatase activity
LLDSVPSDYVLNVIDEVSKYVAKKLGLSVADFAAVLKKEQPVTSGEMAEEFGYFATVTAQVLRRLGGEYTKFAEELDKHNQKINNKEQVKVKQYWLFQGNPKYYRVLDSIHDFEQMYWLVTRYTEDIAVGDGVLIWSAGKKAGIYAMGEVIGPVNILEELPDKDYWIVKNMSQPEGKRVFTNFTTKLLENPLLYEELIQDDILKNLSVISDARGTNFQVTQEQWMQVYELRKSQIESYKLRNFLAEGKWKEADEETARLMFKIADREKERWLRVEDIEQFPSSDLQTIDRLWVEYSNGRFGFSVQKQIYQSLGGTKEFNQKITEAFWDKVGLIINNQPYWSQYDNLTFNLSAPVGHLPIRYDVETPSGIIGVVEGLLCRPDLVLPQSEIFLRNYLFETVTVNHQGAIIKNETKKAQFFHEILPHNILLEMIAIPGGKFMMGGSKNEKSPKDEFPQHEVNVQPFFMGKYEVTQAQWRIIADMTELKVNCDLDTETAFFKGDDRPVDSVSWYDAVEFCDRLSKLTGRQYRLPSEAEWEYACRAGTTTPFYFGDCLTDKLANYNATINYKNEPIGEYRQKTTPVGSFYPNNFGLYDLHGNLWEWCQDDWHYNYEDAPDDGSSWMDEVDNIGSYKEVSSYGVLRGGCWNDSPKSCRSANRHSAYAKRKNRRRSVGFRIVCVSERNNTVKQEKELDEILESIPNENSAKYLMIFAFYLLIQSGLNKIASLLMQDYLDEK